MSVKVAKSRFIVFSRTELYQRLIRSVSSFQTLGERLIYEAENAQAFRQTEKLEELSLMLSNFPLQEYKLAGQYYFNWCVCRKGENAKEGFEKVAEISNRYRARALIDLGTIEASRGEFASGLKLYTEAIKYAYDARALTQASRSIAAVKGLEGFHAQALRDFEGIGPIANYGHPIEYYQYLNSLAVELVEVGRIEEANNICKVILASPYAFAYPEWRETANEIALRGYKSRSVISFRQKQPENLLRLPERKSSESFKRSPFHQPRGVTKLLDWKKKMGKKPNGDEEDKEQLSDRQMVMKIMEYATDDDLPDEALLEMLEAIKKISNSYKSKK